MGCWRRHSAVGPLLGVGAVCLVGALMALPEVRAVTVAELRTLIQRKEQEILILQKELQELRKLLAQKLQEEQAREGGAPSATAASQFTTPLDPGDSGSEVRKLQELLHAWGYYPEGLITGYYGTLTQKAVERFQAAKGIVSSGTPSTTGYGRVGPATLRALNAELLARGGGIAEVAPQAGGDGAVAPQSGESGYKEVVKVRAYHLGSKDPSQEYLVLEVKKDARFDVVMTGWTIESSVTGTRITIPKAASLFRFGGVQPASEAIRVPPGGRLVLITGPSPMAQASFRTNKCSGYLNAFYRFTPSLSRTSCPDPEEEFEARADVSARDVACAEYVRRLSTCTIPDVKRLPSSLSLSCRYFLTKELNYNACVDAHRNDADFWGGEWRVYLQRSSSLWRNRYERLLVRDASGLVVAELTR